MTEVCRGGSFDQRTAGRERQLPNQIGIADQVRSCARAIGKTHDHLVGDGLGAYSRRQKAKGSKQKAKGRRQKTLDAKNRFHLVFVYARLHLLVSCGLLTAYCFLERLRETKLNLTLVQTVDRRRWSRIQVLRNQKLRGIR